MENKYKSDSKMQSLFFRRKIGSTIYEVSIYFSKRSQETIKDKINRLIQQEYAEVKLFH